MSKEETPPAGGLLSKTVRFVRNPTVQWTELDSLTEDRESQYSKQMLKSSVRWPCNTSRWRSLRS